MPVVSLTRLLIPVPVSLPALRRYVLVGRQLARQSGCLGWQTYRGIYHTDQVFAVSYWQRQPPDMQGVIGEELLAAVDLSATLPRWFEASFGCETTPASLVRFSRVPSGAGAEQEARDKDTALRSMAAPGSLRVRLARNVARSVYLCAIDFDTDDALWAFLESPLRRAWTEKALAAGEEETWAINLPRLDFTPRPQGLGPLEIPASRTETRFGPLNIVLEQHGRPGSVGTAAVRAHGQLDRRGVPRLERVCRTLAANGCRSLLLDISELRVVPEAMADLLRMVRELKQVVDRLELVDNAQRFRHVTRMAHLEQSLRSIGFALPQSVFPRTRRHSR
ncbi:MAG: hypothetical protein HY320_02745 [Armatimonadetes bacterium]|nr:hypothetical protein [Armatimonadota bacterium]